MKKWRLAKSLEVLLKEVNSLFPNREKHHDGTIGDQAHQARFSDHNPNAEGVVCAVDITHDPKSGADMGKISDYIAKNPHPNLDYIIFNKRIASRNNGFTWKPYYGQNPHDKHMHVSVGFPWGYTGRKKAGSDSVLSYDSTASWELKAIIQSKQKIKIIVNDKLMYTVEATNPKVKWDDKQLKLYIYDK